MDMFMPGFLKVTLWVRLVDLAAIASCAAILGHSAAAYFDRAAPVVARPIHRPRRIEAPATDAGPIIARNIFCSTCKVRGEGPPARSLAPGPTDLPLALIAVLVAPPPYDARSSLAVIRDLESKRLSIVGVGDRLRQAAVGAIDETRVHLLRDGRHEFLDLLDAGARPVPSVQRGPTFAIRQLDERSYEIERSTLDAVLGDTTGLMRAARIVAEVRDGRSVGFRLHAVRPDGIIAQLGLRNGDVILAVNGLPLTSPEGGLDAFVKLRAASHVSLGLEREGRRITCDYRIR